jgi:putative tryptophan/tyrosine transport system substrate-binding protein
MDTSRRAVCAVLAALAAGGTDAQTRVHRIGYLSLRASPAAIDEAFISGMRDLGYVEGRNLAIEYRWAANDPARLETYAGELTRARVEVIVTATTAGTRATMQATRTIPIVMAAAADPVAAGLVASLARPGGNVTGVSLQTTDMARKRVQLARELVPGATRIALLAEKVASSTQGTTASLVAESAAAARSMDAALTVGEITTIGELGDAFAKFLRERAQVLIVQVSALLLEHRAAVVEHAARARLPAIYEARNFVEAGGLASYGPDLAETYRRAARFVDRILKGARPSDLPVEQPERMTLAISLRAAAAIGLAIPDALRIQAELLP